MLEALLLWWMVDGGRSVDRLCWEVSCLLLRDLMRLGDAWARDMSLLF